MQRTMKKYWFIAVIVVVIPVTIGIYHSTKAMPKHISYESAVYHTNDVQFLYDLTYEKNSERVMEQQLKREALSIIEEAEDFLVVDLFLYNDDYDRAKGDYPAAAADFTNALLEKRAVSPDMPMTVITDAVNELYGAVGNRFFEQLRAQQIDVIITNTKPLRDSNPLYSSVWRTYLQWWPVSDNGFLPNAFNPDGGKGSFGAYFDLLNFKANHRKIVMNESRALITSANLTHDGSSFHSNIGFTVSGPILADVYKSEQAVAALSHMVLKDYEFPTEQSGELAVKLVTEGKIQDEVLRVIRAAESIQIGVFYMADRKLIAALKEAAARGVNIQLLLDPNKDAFGLEKNGIPNRQIAAELMREPNVDVRFYATNGEQFHSKFLYAEAGDTATLIGGSANFTRRNVQDYNLESNLTIMMPKDAAFAKEFQAYYARIWHNEDGEYTVDFAQYEDQSIWKKLVYRFQEWTGLSTF
ncbi:MAG: phospholipase D-like domain-containing protein [Solibacillus sp.]